MRRRTSPVQQWVDSLPSPAKSNSSSVGSIVRQQSVSVESEPVSVSECTVEQVLNEKENFSRHSNMTVSTPIAVPNSPAIVCPGRNVSRLARDPSFQSDSSHCSSIESLLELRRADPEAMLLSLGFGGCAGSPQENGPLSRIPKRFLQPSKLKGIALNDFVKHQQETSESLDSTSLGYRGLTGSPYVAPSEIVQKIMQRLREHETHELDAYNASLNSSNPYDSPYAQHQQEGRLSVLSPDNRQFLERPRSKSPDMRNKRMIIGQRSFAFGHDGDLIEINPRSTQTSQESDDVFDYSDDAKETNQTGPTNHALSVSRNKMDSSGNMPSNRSKPSLVDLKSSFDNRDSTETVTPARLSSSVDKNCNLHEPKYLSVGYNSNKNGSPRRASEGSYEKSSLLDQEDGRRFSDGVMHSINKDEGIAASSTPLSARRKSLKRQTRIRDIESADDVISLDDDDDSNAGSSRLQHASEVKKCTHCGTVERQHEGDDEEESCCYRRSSLKCWKEMEKVLQKNKKLEEVVAKSRREMAEIRGMLSSVLSVRMEPGF